MHDTGDKDYDQIKNTEKLAFIKGIIGLIVSFSDAQFYSESIPESLSLLLKSESRNSICFGIGIERGNL